MSILFKNFSKTSFCFKKIFNFFFFLEGIFAIFSSWDDGFDFKTWKERHVFFWLLKVNFESQNFESILCTAATFLYTPCCLNYTCQSECII
uniref:Uncharacterized protein n=1 Tax=Strigamia maritima TaxID=126957 RepID=T1JLN6_STRMM